MSIDPAITVLLLEDDAEDHRLIVRLLRKQQCPIDIQWARTLAAAIDLLATQSIDVVLTDLSLPDSHGNKTVTELRKHCGQQPIIVLTSLENESVEKELMSAGAQDYLVKGNFGTRDIVRAIQHSLHRQLALNEVNRLVERLEQSQQLLQDQSRLLTEKNSRLNQLNKTAHEFVDSVSHDLRTPLTVIKDYVSIIREGMVGDINDEQRVLLDKVAVRADDLNNMVDDLLDVSKLESNLLGAWRRNVSVGQLMERAESMLQQRAQVKNVELLVTSDEALPDVYCDADKVGRVITNLAVNAIKFCGKQGRVQLWAKLDPANHQVVIGVTDNGPGIEPKSLDRLFHRFQQLEDHVKTTEKGFGLGLTIAQKLCRVNFGELHVESVVGTGSTFSFSLPLAEPVEVLRRWLEQSEKLGDSIRVIEVTTLAGSTETQANEFDNFLNCLLRSKDLLFRVGPERWLWIAATGKCEQDNWLHRANDEFKKTNRNRPLGPLPNFNTKTCCQWSSDCLDAEILNEFAIFESTIDRELLPV